MRASDHIRTTEGGSQVRRSFGHLCPIVHEDHIGPVCGRVPTRDVDGCRFQLREEHVIPPGGLEILRQAGTIGQPRARSHDTNPVRGLQMLGLSRGDRDRGRRCEERIPSSHICERHWKEVGHQDPRIAQRTTQVSGEVGDVL